MDADVVIRLLLRFILVPLGGAAALAAGTAAIVIAHHRALSALVDASPQAQEEYFIALAFAGPFLAVLLSIWAYHTFVPALIGVVIAEALALRSWIYHAANGAVAAWLGFALTRDLREEYRFLTDPGPLLAAGLVGGLVYWLIAGWTAGFWKPVSSPVARIERSEIREGR
jgi:hypothetical protein